MWHWFKDIPGLPAWKQEAWWSMNDVMSKPLLLPDFLVCSHLAGQFKRWPLYQTVQTIDSISICQTICPSNYVNLPLGLAGKLHGLQKENSSGAHDLPSVLKEAFPTKISTQWDEAAKHDNKNWQRPCFQAYKQGPSNLRWFAPSLLHAKDALSRCPASSQGIPMSLPKRSSNVVKN